MKKKGFLVIATIAMLAISQATLAAQFRNRSNELSKSWQEEQMAEEAPTLQQLGQQVAQQIAQQHMESIRKGKEAAHTAPKQPTPPSITMRNINLVQATNENGVTGAKTTANNSSIIQNEANDFLQNMRSDRYENEMQKRAPRL